MTKKVSNNNNKSKTAQNKKTKTEIIEEKSIVKENKTSHIYFSFYKRLTINVIFFIITAFFGTLALKNSFTVNNEKVINYKEKSNLDYRVYLLPNSFYEEKYLGKNMLYVASLIDNIEVDFDYILSSNSNMNIDFNYSINADLVITNKEGTRSYYQKKYVLLENQTLNMNNNNIQKINEKIKIDYSHYNSLANKFKSSFGVETESKLNVYMTINKNNSSYKLNDNNKMNITIPLSEKSVDIQMKYNDINDSNSVLSESEFFVNNYFLIIVSVLFIIISIVLLFNIIKKLLLLRTKRSIYDIQVRKILKEYDRLIAESTTLLPFDDKNIVKVKSFTELLDIHDNLQLPIIYYTVTNHHKCYFYISHNDTIYLFVLKAIDLEVSKNANKK